MKNHKKGDKLFVNKIDPPDDIERVSAKPAGDAEKDPFCVYDHERHGVGSKIENYDGSETTCTDKGWQRNP